VSTPLWVSELSSTFWDLVGAEEAFPRNLRQSILFGVPLSVIHIPALRVESIHKWLAQKNISCPLEVSDRRLRACLLTRFGCGLIFIDTSDSLSEQRFSLAHEIAHYLKDYWKPRQEAIQQLGEGVLEVLDGKRQATTREIIHSLLAKIPIEVHIHMMERDAKGVLSHSIKQTEADADRLAFELLAPSLRVLDDVAGLTPEQQRPYIERHLVEFYGFPEEPARRYTNILFPQLENSSWFHLLGLGR
jgi:hypothetical protein